ncbi:MAG: outer membrane beta-barrel protein [Steroidobacteraceae bacterium]
MPKRPVLRVGMALFAAVPLSASGSAPEANAVSGPAPTADERINQLSREVADLKNLVLELQDQLRKAIGAPSAGISPPKEIAAPAVAAPAAPAVAAPAVAPAASAPAANSNTGPFGGTTINVLLDGYYEWNSNSPVGRTNYLRAYDVSSNSFSLNQADVVLESAPDLTIDKRYGVRLDLQFGQATSTLQGNPANELRPDVYRNVFQAYGTYIFPVAAGLTFDFGKWASSLGLEGNYTKDQLNYSRSFLFDFLPFYHTGLRSKLALNEQLALNVWITNGTQQTEAFNNYKDQMFGILFTPTPALSWTMNYYQGQEHPDVMYEQVPTQPNLPYQQGTYILPIANAPNGKLQIIDSYVTWQVLPSLILAAEADHVQQRLYSYSSPVRVDGGALYAGYQFFPKLALAARAEYVADIGGLFSGATQYLKEGTLTLDYRPADHFLMRGEYRRDQSNRPYFLGHTLGMLESAQSTIGLGLVWWFGQKDGVW